MPEALFSNPWFFAVLNALIITVTLLSGAFFYETGLIHLLSLLFAIFALRAVRERGRFQDPYMKYFLFSCTLSMAVLALTHLMEFPIEQHLIQIDNHDTGHALIIFWIAASFCLIGSGTEHLLSEWRAKRRPAYAILLGLAIFFLVLPFFLMFDPNPFQADMTLRGVIFAFIPGALLILLRVFQLKNSIPLLRDFSIRLFGAMLCVLLACVFEFFEVFDYDFLTEVQNEYLSQFLTLGGLSFFILAFGRLRATKGIYAEL